jgi:integrase
MNNLINLEKKELNLTENFIDQKEKKRKAGAEAKALKRQIRLKASKWPQRQTITPAEFYKIIEQVPLIYKHSITRARVKVAIPLLYMTGLRITNLRAFPGIHMHELYTQGAPRGNRIK